MSRVCECGHGRVSHRFDAWDCRADRVQGLCPCRRYVAPAAVEVEMRGAERLPGFGEEES